MTTINPLYIYEILKQKVDWGTLLTPVNKFHDLLESFNTTEDQSIIMNARDLSDVLVECKDKVEDKDIFKNLDLGKEVKSILANLSNACIIKNPDGSQKIQIEMNILGSDKKITDLIKPTSTEKEIVSAFQDAKTKVKKYGYVNIGKELSAEKKDILGLISALLKQSYEKSATKDGEFKQEVKGEIGILSSDNKKFVEILDMTGVKNNAALCDVSESQITNIISITNITKIRSLEGGKTFCLDLQTSRSYQQSRVLSVTTTEPEKKSSMNTKRIKDESTMEDSSKNNGNGSIPDETLKNSVLESYLASYLSSVYKDKDKWDLEWMRLSPTSILLKIKSADGNETIFHKFDATNAVLDTSECPEYKIDPRVREFIYFQEFCKKDTQYKLKYGLIGTENSNIVGIKVAFVKLVEAKNKQELDNFRNNFGKFDKAYFSTVPYYSTSFSGLYNLGLYNSGVYSYPYAFSGVTPYYGSYYVPPVASYIVPTAPVVSTTPYTYTYPPITSTSQYTLGSYYAPYTYSYATPFTYGSPYYYGYSSPYSYYYVKSEDERNGLEQNYLRLIKTDMDEFDKFRNVKYVVPAKASNIRELSSHFVDQNMKSVNIEKISNALYKIEFEKNYIKQTHYYSFENDGLYHVSAPTNMKLI
jgi:hypothetical protein